MKIEGKEYRTIWFENNVVKIIDQTKLPHQFIIKNLKHNKDYPTVFKTSTKEALDEFKGKKIKIGRARMFEDKTKDLDDPGMFAFYKLCR